MSGRSTEFLTPEDFLEDLTTDNRKLRLLRLMSGQSQSAGVLTETYLDVVSIGGSHVVCAPSEDGLRFGMGGRATGCPEAMVILCGGFRSTELSMMALKCNFMDPGQEKAFVTKICTASIFSGPLKVYSYSATISMSLAPISLGYDFSNSFDNWLFGTLTSGLANRAHYLR